MGSKQSKNYKKMQDQKEAAKLRRQIKALKKFPKNFRDADPDSRAFQDVLATMDLEQQKVMNDWMKGPILYCHPLTNIERRMIGPDRLIRSVKVNLTFDDKDPNTHFEARLYRLSLADLRDLTEEALIVPHNGQSISFIYIKNIPLGLFKGLNAIAKYAEHPFRYKEELTDDKGRTPGL